MGEPTPKGPPAKMNGTREVNVLKVLLLGSSPNAGNETSSQRMLMLSNMRSEAHALLPKLPCNTQSAFGRKMVDLMARA